MRGGLAEDHGHPPGRVQVGQQARRFARAHKDHESLRPLEDAEADAAHDRRNVLDAARSRGDHYPPLQELQYAGVEHCIGHFNDLQHGAWP